MSIQLKLRQTARDLDIAYADFNAQKAVIADGCDIDLQKLTDDAKGLDYVARNADAVKQFEEEVQELIAETAIINAPEIPYEVFEKAFPEMSAVMFTLDWLIDFPRTEDE